MPRASAREKMAPKIVRLERFGRLLPLFKAKEFQPPPPGPKSNLHWVSRAVGDTAERRKR